MNREEARRLGVLGWNLRCNSCGSYGAEWLDGERPGWGALALCPVHAEALREVHAEYRAALALLRYVRYEQDEGAARR